jgi:ABC-type transporter Mla subunit MlaD
MADTTVEILIRAQENVSQAVNEVKQQFEGLSQHTQSVFGRINHFLKQNEEAFISLAKIGAVVAGTLTALAAIGTRHANQLREEALQIGTTVEKYSLYRAMLQDLEIHAELIPMFIMRMQVAFQQAAQAVAEKGDRVNELTVLLAQLGQTVQSQTTDPLEQFVLLLKQIAQISDQARQAQILFELFGRRAYTLLPVLRQGAQEIDNLITKYRELGVTVSDEAANKIDDLSDAFGTLGNAIKASLAEGFSFVAPTIKAIVEKVNELVAALKNLGKEHPTLASFVSHFLALAAAVVVGLGALGALVHALKFVVDGLKALGALKVLVGLKNLVGSFGALKSAIAGIVGAINPLLAAITLIAVVFGVLIRKIDSATGSISKFLAKLMTAKEARKYIEETVTETEYTAEQREKDKEALERFYRERPYLLQFERQYAQKYYGKVGSLKGLEAPKIEMPPPSEVREREAEEWRDWREKTLETQNNIVKYWSGYLAVLRNLWQDWFNYRKQFYEDLRRKYYDWIDKQKEALERITQAEIEMRNRMAEAYESAARLAANLAGRAGIYHIRFGTFGYFAIPVVQEIQPAGYTLSREEMTLSYTAYIYFYAQQIWISIQHIILLLQQAVGHLAFIAQSVAKSAGGATLNVNVPFGYDQIRNAIADAVNETLGKQLAYELVRNA